MLVEPLKLQGVIAGFNGGVYVNPDQSVILSRTLDPGAARKAYDAIRDHKLDAWVYTAEDWMIRDPAAPHVDREGRTVQFGPKVVPDPAKGLDRAVKIVGVSDDLALVETCEADVQRALGNTVSAARSQPYYLDVTHPEANKGNAVRLLAAQFGVELADVAVLGDMANDLPMFDVAGFAVAMGNGSAEVQARAAAVTGSNDGDGWAQAIDQFILPRGH